MKKAGVVLFICFGVIACNNGGSSSDVKIDSIGRTVDSSSQRSWDSTKNKARGIEENIDRKLKNIDSVDTSRADL
jgi:hypothetical protein